MKAVQSNEAFKRIDGCMRFSYVNYYVQRDGALYRGKWKDRHQTPQTLDQLDEIQQIQTEDRGPMIDSTWSLTHVKKPSLESYLNPDLEGQLRREITVCELLRQHPHPNIAAYYGCQETRGRVSGLCPKRYRTTLLEKYMPQSLNKGDFPSTRDGWSMSTRPGHIWRTFSRGSNTFTSWVWCTTISTPLISCSMKMARLS